MVPADNGIEVVVMRRLADGEAARAAIAVLSADERERAQRFILPRHRLQFVERRAALRRLLGERLGIAAARVRLSTAIDGKPSLAAPLDRSGVTFNQSHCGDLSVYAFASRTDIGVDVEAIRVIEDADHVASIAFSKREYETYERLPPSDKPIGFLNCWTRKEAFVKAVGSGLSHSLDGFDVSLMPNEPPRLLRLGSIDGSSGWQLHSFFPVSGFIAALAARATA
ncbi:MAG TPA: 4'-phosphopantetheinyl transferase superfamily protein [Vicinamibacterales bacterium]|nr:4'-phosphopantetheinyl transferase superfamily protein [Vicinamibacterales bacterium]